MIETRYRDLTWDQVSAFKAQSSRITPERWSELRGKAVRIQTPPMPVSIYDCAPCLEENGQSYSVIDNNGNLIPSSTGNGHKAVCVHIAEIGD